MVNFGTAVRTRKYNVIIYSRPRDTETKTTTKTTGNYTNFRPSSCDFFVFLLSGGFTISQTWGGRRPEKDGGAHLSFWQILPVLK